MLSIFRTNQLLWSFLLIFYAAILHMGAFLVMDDWQPSRYGILSAWVYSWSGVKGWLPDLLTILLLAIHGTILNGLNASHRLDNTVSLFPGLFYILIASLLPEFIHLSPLHMANTFYLLALADLMSVYNERRSAGYIFNAGLWIGIGSLFYFSYIVFFLLAFVSLNILRAFELRERLMVLTGIAVPYLLAGLYFFWFDQFDLFLKNQFIDNVQYVDLSLSGLSLEASLKLGLFSLLLMIVLFSHDSYISKKIIQEQKKINILFWALLVPSLTLLFQAGIQLDHLLILTLPLGLLLSINFSKMSNNWAELFHFLLFIIALMLQFKPLIGL